MPARHLIVGGGTAGLNCIRTIREEERGAAASEITLVAAERPYSRMCKSAGGTYNTSDQTCDAPAVNKKKASAMCDAHGGTYLPDLQICELEGTGGGR